MKNTFTSLFLFFFTIGLLQAQNPYASLGEEANVLTLSEGKYQEHFPNEANVVIGGVKLNTQTGKVVELLKPEEEESLETTVSTRFLSVDPIARQYPELTPYQFASNRPIDGIDLDGLEYDDSKLKFIVNADKTEIKVQGEVTIKIKILNLSSTIVEKRYKDHHTEKSSRTFDIPNFSFNDYMVYFPDGSVNEDKKKYTSVKAKNIDINFEFIGEYNKISDIKPDDIVLILGDDIERNNSHGAHYGVGGVAEASGHVYAIVANQFNKSIHIDTHEKGHLIGHMADWVKGSKKGFLMSYSDDGKGYKLRFKDKISLITSLIDRRFTKERSKGSKNNTRQDVEDFIDQNEIKIKE